MFVVGCDTEWSKEGIDVLGLAFDEGLRCTATARTDESMGQFLRVLKQADVVVGQNILDADIPQLEKEGIDVSWLREKCFDTRLGVHATHSHLAGTGSYDLRSIVLLLNGRQGTRFPLDFKQYESDLHKTCGMDSAAALWCYPTLARLITSRKLDGVVKTAHLVAPIFAQMREQGVRLDTRVLEQIYSERKVKLERDIESYGLWEERGKKVIKRVPIWRSKRVLDKFEQQFGVRPANLQRSTWDKLANTSSLPEEAREFARVVVELGQGANDQHWLGAVTETDDGLDFSKVSSTGFIHARYDICGSPDRAISSSPNVQNFPRVAEDPRPVALRSAVVPLHEGMVILSIDFSAVETITNAYESQDMDRVVAVLNGSISHEGTAAMLNSTFNLSLTRTQAKICNHAADKGESPWNLACRLFNTERPSRQQTVQCQAIFRRMLADYPKTDQFRDRLWERSVENPLTVTNSFGRQLQCFSRSKYGDSSERYAKHVPEKKYWCTCAACAPRRDRWKYAIAFLGRSCAFDCLLTKMVRVWYDRVLDEYSLPYMEIHDELDFCVPEDKIELYAKRLKECFDAPIPELNGISLPSDYKYGYNWAQCK